MFSLQEGNRIVRFIKPNYYVFIHKMATKPTHMILLEKEEPQLEPFEYFFFDDTQMYNSAEKGLQEIMQTKYFFPDLTDAQWDAYTKFFENSQEERRKKASNLIKSLTELRGQGVED